MRRVVVTGLGAITPLGVGIKETWSRLLQSHSGIVSTSSLSPPSSLSATAYTDLPSQVAGIVPLGSKKEGGWDAGEWLDQGQARRMAKYTQYAIAATHEALQDAGWTPTNRADLEATGVCLGSGIGNLEELYDTSVAFHNGGYKKLAPLFVPKLLINMAAGHISMKYGFQGPNHTVTTACTTGAHAVGDAGRFIAVGDADVMIAGGSESCIHPLAIAGFSRSRSLSANSTHAPHLASRPFDVSRSGFVIAEGCAVLVLEELEHAKARGAEIYAELIGYGCSGDAHHMTAPSESGYGAVLAMKRALRQSGKKPADVDYMNAHATSTPLGDRAENTAIKTVLLGEEGFEKASNITVSSTKGAIGHLLGAAGAIEAAFSILAVKNDIVPPTLNLETPDEGFDCNYVPKTAQQKTVNVALSNSFGFGGTNSTLAFAKYR